jgi:hypothetical protein
MMAALAYLEFCSWKNRMRLRLRRMRQVKYLLGALLGAVYIGWMLWMFAAGNPLGATRLPAEVWAVFELGGTLFLILFVVLDWLLPTKRAALDFTEAEIAFLFPAPVTRRGLIHFKLAKVQLGILLSAALMGLFSGRYRSGSGAWMHLVGWWFVLLTVHLHALGASFTRTLLLDRGRSHWERRFVVLAIVLVLGGLTLWWSWESLPPFPRGASGGWAAVGGYARGVLYAQPLGWLLIPFRLVLGPVFAQNGPGFLAAAVPALGVLFLLYYWVIHSEATFQEASLEKAQRMAQIRAAVQSGDWHMAREKARGVRAPFALRREGPRFTALVWKNFIAAEFALNLSTWAILALVYFLVMWFFRSFSISPAWAMGLGIMPWAFTPMVVLFGPALMRFDFRQDLRLADVLKTWPLPGWQLVLGEVLAPTVVLTLVEGAFITLATLFFPEGPRSFDLTKRITFGVSAMIIAPGLNLFSFLLFNGAALFYPAWFRAEPGAGQGFDAVGHQMLFLLGQLVLTALALLLPGAAFAGVHFLARHWLALPLLLPVASVAAAAVLAFQGYLGLRMLGDLFERIDISQEIMA